MISNLLKPLLLVMFCLISVGVKAACTLTNTTIDLPKSNSFYIFNNPVTATSSAVLSCTGLSIQILASNKVDVTLVSSLNNLKLLNTNNSGDTIAYNIYADASYQLPFVVGQVMNYRDRNLLSIVIGTSTVRVPFYVRTIAGSNIQAGKYTDTLTFSWDYFICTSINILGVCLGGESEPTPNTRTVTVNLEIDKQCTIDSAPDINFGSYALVGQFNPITQSINLSCTKTEGYKVSFSDGNNRLAGSWRRMADGAGNFMQYNIYQSNGTTVWDSNNKVTGQGTGVSQSLSYKAIINAAQAALPVGTYTDQVSVTVEY